MSVKRKHIPKKVRQAVYRKYDGHCAYCGKPIEYHEMQVDHMEPLSFHRGDGSFENLMPSCRRCNYYKDAFSVEVFRQRLATIVPNLRERQFIYNLAVQYGQVTETVKPILFYYETHDENRTDQ